MPLTIPQGLYIANNNPVDNRFVFETLAKVKSELSNARRYRGLKIFVLDEKLEYWFRDGITDDDLIPYRSGSPIVVSTITERDNIPTSLRYCGMEVNLLETETVTKYVLVGGIENEDWQKLYKESRNESVIIGDGATKDFHISHALGQKFVAITIYDDNGVPNVVRYTCTTTTQAVVQFDVAPAIGETFRVVCRI